MKFDNLNSRRQGEVFFLRVRVRLRVLIFQPWANASYVLGGDGDLIKVTDKVNY